MSGLTGRLGFLFNEIPDNCDTLADIGCDHGKLLVEAVKRGRAKRGFAVDISGASLDKAVKLAAENGVGDRISFFCGDGLKPLPAVVDCAVIAGIGGIEIIKILREGGGSAKSYILSPHSDEILLRKFMKENGYRAARDFYICDGGKYYPVIFAFHGENDYKYEEIYLGKNRPAASAAVKRHEKRKEILERAIAAAGKERADKEILTEYEVLKKWCGSNR
jgi:tRNA (adenine22-N1)-methyltransferase